MSPVTRREFVCFAGLAAAGAAAGESLTASSESEPQTAGKRSELAVSEAAGASRQATPVRPAQTQPAAAKGQAETQPAALARGTPGQPVLCGSANAIRACDRAIELLRQGGDPVDAVVAGVNIIEDDPHDHSVGYGGLPNEDGVVELDASVMHGPLHRAGAVAALRNIRNPSSVARLVMRWTDHVLLVGEGALRFAKAMGFKEEELLTDEARAIWLKWKATHSADDDWLYPEANEEAERWRRTHHAERQPGAALRGRPDAAVGESGGAIRSATDATARRLRDDGIEFTYGTINCLALTPTGDLGGCTSTSGLSYKLAGRVGDSPIIGAGLYVDNEVGGCGSTGRGEANLLNCTSFLAVEFMRSGRGPTAACLEALRRVAQHTEKRLRNAAGEPDFGLSMYALRKDGQVGGATMRAGEGGAPKMAVHDGSGTARLVELPALYGGKASSE